MLNPGTPLRFLHHHSASPGAPPSLVSSDPTVARTITYRRSYNSTVRFRRASWLSLLLRTVPQGSLLRHAPCQLILPAYLCPHVLRRLIQTIYPLGPHPCLCNPNLKRGLDAYKCAGEAVHPRYLSPGGIHILPGKAIYFIALKRGLSLLWVSSLYVREVR